MKIAIHSGSDAVRRALAQLLEAAGHEPVEAEAAQLLLVDALHPSDTASTKLPSVTIGDDALPCPLRVASLLQAIQRAATPSVALRGEWVFDPTARALHHANHAPVALTEKESALLQALLSAPVEGVARENLLADIWGVKHEADTHTLETHLYRLRAKLGGLSPVPAELINENGRCRAVAA